TLGAWPRNRLVPNRELALRGVRASVERALRLAALYDDIPAAIRTGYTGRFLLHILTVRGIRAGREWSKADLCDHQVVLAALRAHFFEDDVRCRDAAALLNLPGCLAFRISRTGQKLAKSASLQNHWLTAVFAGLLSRSLGGFFAAFVVNLRNVSSSLAFRIVGAGQKLAIAAELDFQSRSAILADLIGLDFLALHVAHIFLCRRQVLGEFLIEFGKRVGPDHLSFFDLVQFLFHMGGVLDIEQIVKALHQQIVYNHAELGWNKTAVLSCHIFAILYYGHYRSVS